LRKNIEGDIQCDRRFLFGYFLSELDVNAGLRLFDRGWGEHGLIDRMIARRLSKEFWIW
jgi:hypothetical protein